MVRRRSTRHVATAMCQRWRLEPDAEGLVVGPALGHSPWFTCFTKRLRDPKRVSQHAGSKQVNMTREGAQCGSRHAGASGFAMQL